MELTHFDKSGKAIMVDITDKKETNRIAVAKGKIKVNDEVYAAIQKGTSAKGDVLAAATIAGIMAAKKTWELIPMCHMLKIESCKIDFENDDENRLICCTCTVKTTGKTGAEMEALTGVSTALLTVYDMCKALDKNMEIGQIYLAEKDGGKSGRIVNER